jgi:enoyl-CoA hydratase
MMREIGTLIDELATNAKVGAIIITGQGARSSQGRTFRGSRRQGQATWRSSRGSDRLFSVASSFRPKPVIAAVNGFALGGGCELALACRVRIASAQAKFGLPKVHVGLCPDYGRTQRRPRLVGRGAALHLILTGDTIDGTEAARLGLANAVVEPDALPGAARAMAATMLKNAPVALARAIEAVDVGLDTSLEDGLRLEARLFGSLETTADMREGTRAFLEKRPAEFRGA